MMRGELLCWDGRRIRLPDAVEWQFQYGCGTPCDSFQLTCLWEPDSGNDLAEAVSFTAEENGERLFTGVVDECERGWDTAGGTLTVAGRGRAARLLDNEALGADYQVATVEDILRDHVAPYGIETVRGAELPPVPGFSVDAGSSEWQVVYEFCRYYGGIAPRFDRLGRLVLAPWEEGRRLVLRADAAVTSFRLREQRYGAAGAAVCSPCRERAAIRPCAIPGRINWPAPGKSCGRQSWSCRRPLPRGRGNWWSSTWPRGRDGASGGYGRAYAA